jgi:subtilisin family serine protease
MRIWVGAALGAALVATAIAGADPGEARSPLTVVKQPLEAFEPEVVPGEVLVRYRRGAPAAERLALQRALGARATTLTRWGLQLLHLPPGTTTAAALAALQTSPLVARAEPNRVFRVAAPNDPRFGQLWGLDNTGQQHPISDPGPPSAAGTPDADIDAPEAWAVTEGDPSTVIAVVDSGVDVTHPDLAANLWVNPGETVNGLDDDGNGLVDDVNGWDFAENDATLFEPNSSIVGFDHGTHVAGTIAATGNNGQGVIGVCPDCRVMVLKFMEPADTDGDGSRDTMVGDTASLIAALDYAAAEGAHIVNGSFGGVILWSAFERNAFKRLGAAGVLAVLAAGNDNGDNDQFVNVDFDSDGVSDALAPAYPASYDLPLIVSVAASNHADEYGYFTGCAVSLGVKGPPCSFTSWGRSEVDLAAPGVDVVSTLPGNSYGAFNGTSMATPHVAGVAGLIRSQHPGYTAQQIKNALLNSVDEPATLRSLRAFPGVTATGDFTLTSGRVNAAAALSASTTTPAPPDPDGTIAGALPLRRRSVSGAVTWPGDSNDVYEKRLERGRYRVILDGPAGRDLDLLVWDRGVKEIWQFEAGCLGQPGRCKLLGYPATLEADERVTFTARRSGVYRFQVTAFLLSGGSYSLRIERL